VADLVRKLVAEVVELTVIVVLLLGRPKLRAAYTPRTATTVIPMTINATILLLKLPDFPVEDDISASEDSSRVEI
jgi:hypothetical protein